MTSDDSVEDLLFIEECTGHQARYQKLLQFTGSSTKAAAVMLAAAIVAIIFANSGLYSGFTELWDTETGFFIGAVGGEMSLAEIINDIFMAVFFLMIGLEIKYEMTVGELTNIRQALLPIVAACGGVLFPILIYLVFNAGNDATSHGWGVPTATDIAFALGIMSLLGNRVPNGVRVFLTTLAVADDIIAILIIALFYGQSPSMLWLAAVAVIMAVLILMNRSHIFALAPYLLVGAVLWYCVFMSGIHATIAGVLLAFTIPSGSKINLKSFIEWSNDKVKAAKEQFEPDAHIMGQQDYMYTVSTLSAAARHVVPPATRLEHMLNPWVNFAILPLFALTNADVRFIGGALGDFWADPALYGVFFGLLLGKPIGIMLFSFIVTKLKVATLPSHTNWLHMLGAGILGGVGFTMAIFVANLAFDDPAIVATAKLGILSASALAGVIGFVFLWMQARDAKQRGIAYITISGTKANRQFAGTEASRRGKEFLDGIDSTLLKNEVEAAHREDGVADVVVDIDGDK